MPMVITDPRQPDNPIVYCNAAFTELTGYTADDVVGRNCRFLQGPGTDPEAAAKIRMAIGAKLPIFQVDILNYKKDGTPFWNGLFLSPVVDDDGEIVYYFGSQHDVTERKRGEQTAFERKLELEVEVRRRTSDLQKAVDELTIAADTKALLLNEVDHRVKNNLQMISSLIILQARKIDDKSIRDALHSMLERVQALSTVHQRLYQSDDISRFDVAELAHDLSGDLVGACGRDDIKVTVNADHVFIRAPKAAPLALVINELITNAIKHAFRDQGGHLRVTVQRLPTQCHIHIEDDGAGLSGKNDSDSFGTTIVRTLARQIGATVSWTPADPGARVDVVFPLDSHELAEATG